MLMVESARWNVRWLSLQKIVITHCSNFDPLDLSRLAFVQRRHLRACVCSVRESAVNYIDIFAREIWFMFLLTHICLKQLARSWLWCELLLVTARECGVLMRSSRLSVYVDLYVYLSCSDFNCLMLWPIKVILVSRYTSPPHLGQGRVSRPRGQGQGHTNVTECIFSGGLPSTEK